MYEVEVKVQAALGPVGERLDALGATPLGTVVQEDTYYDAPHRSFAETDEALRIRRERRSGVENGAGGGDPDGVGPVARVTYKGPLVDDASKTREEVETDVGDPEDADVLLRNLGFEPAATVRKERTRFALDGYTVTLDAVDDVGEYVEVEAEATEDAIEETREGAFEVCKRLGLDPTEQVQTSYLGLLLADEG